MYVYFMLMPFIAYNKKALPVLFWGLGDILGDAFSIA
jgi:hypothetical protein